MKISFQLFLLLHFLLGIAIPKIYFLLFGNILNYSDIYDSNAELKVILITTLSYLVASLLIYILPILNYSQKYFLKGRLVFYLYFFSIFISIFYLISSGGFQGLINLENETSFLYYLNMFLNPMFFLCCCLFFKETTPKYFFIIFFTYLFFTIISGSRAGVYHLIYIFIIGLSFFNFKHVKKQLSRYLIFLIILSPLLFLTGSLVRYQYLSLDIIGLFDLIMVRLSILEIGMIPIHYHDNLNYEVMSLFSEKYNLISQLKVIFDSLFPGNFFGEEYLPNFYYRYIFLGEGLEYVESNYMSINMGLPVYFYLNFGYFSIFLTGIFISMYAVLIHCMRNYPLIALSLWLTLPQFLLYFDFVMIFKTFQANILSILIYKILSNTLFSKKLLLGPKK